MVFFFWISLQLKHVRSVVESAMRRFASSRMCKWWVRWEMQLLYLYYNLQWVLAITSHYLACWASMATLTQSTISSKLLALNSKVIMLYKISVWEEGLDLTDSMLWWITHFQSSKCSYNCGWPHSIHYSIKLDACIATSFLIWHPKTLKPKIAECTVDVDSHMHVCSKNCVLMVAAKLSSMTQHNK